MNDPVFRISRLSCSYSHDVKDRVLYIEDLEIPRGSIVFLLGASGSGKSTLLETLGLMNDTFADGSVEFIPKKGGPGLRLEDLWYQGDEGKLAEIRKSHYSFIFQNTNLMEHFTAYENICLAPMIQTGEDFAKSIQSATAMMDKVNIPLSQVGLDTLSMHLSGGQRQRVTFVRALISEHTVLFCDEPTGNLDERNAFELMNVISESVGEDKTVIIVSHDIRLAMAFADMIVCFSKEDGDDCSTILPRNIFRRGDWETLNEEDRKGFRNRIVEAYDKVTDLYRNTPAVQEKQVQSRSFKYAQLFRSKEGKMLLGKNWRNLLVIMGLLLVTFVAIGFANGSLNYLEEKLKNPFVMWMTMTVPSGRTGLGGDVGQVMQQLNSDSIRQKYDILVVSGYSEHGIDFRRENGRPRRVKARTADPGKDPILDDVMKKDNLLRGAPFRSSKDFGIICTAGMLESLELDTSANYVDMLFRVYDDTLQKSVQIDVPIPIRAVVKELPGKIGMMMPSFFKSAYMQNHGSPFDIRFKSDIRFLVEGTQAQAQAMADELQSSLAPDAVKGCDWEINEPVEHKESMTKGFDVVIDFYGTDYDETDIDSLGKALMNQEWMKSGEVRVKRIYAFDSFDIDFVDKESYDAISLNLSNLEHVRELKDYIYDTFNDGEQSSIIELDVTKVKEKENFFFMSNMTLIISWLVVLFSAISVSLFLFNLLKMHLSKVKTTLGTFKAFGLNDKSTRGIYMFIIFRFLLIAFVVAGLLSYLLGLALNHWLQQVIVVEGGINYFELFHTNTYLTLGIMVVSTFMVSWLTIRSILNKTPGDLIYGR